MGISTHVLDTQLGRPARGVAVTLDRLDGGRPTPVGRGTTNAEGRVTSLLPDGAALAPGTYRLHFDVGAYFAALEIEAFYPSVEIVFTVRRPEEHHHVPLLLAAHGYSTYRGS